MKFVLLWSDALIFMLVIALVAFFFNLRRDPRARDRWSQVFGSRLGMVTFVVIMAYVLVALADSLHFRRALVPEPGQDPDVVYYDNRVISVLDLSLGEMGEVHERTYSAPFALRSFEKQNVKDAQGNSIRDFPPLKYAGQHLESPDSRAADIALNALKGLLRGLLIAALVILPQWFFLRGSRFPWHAAWSTQAVLICAVSIALKLNSLYHVLGTDLGGNDVFYQSIKGIRTGVLLGALATLVMLPIAVTLGVVAGYYKGYADDVVQYLYTTLSSIPGILLIAASVLLFQVYIDLNPDFFEVGLEKADAKFVALCFILGVTSWSTLCRLIRAETLKISHVVDGSLRRVERQLQQRAPGQISQTTALVPPGLVQAQQHRLKAFWRQVSRPDQRVALGCQKDVERPAGLPLGLFDETDQVGIERTMQLTVQFHWHEVAIQDIGNRVVLVTLALHHVAPVTGEITAGDEQQFVLGAGEIDGGLTPILPCDRVLSVHRQIG